MSKERRKFMETGFGQFLEKAGKVVPDVLQVTTQLATGNIAGALDTVTGKLRQAAETDQQAKALLAELERDRQSFELELFRVEAQDRDSARRREVDLQRAGGSDWLMKLVGVVALAVFGFLVYAAIYEDLKNEAVVHQMIGLIEGVMLTIVAYYFGTSKSSAQKTDIMARNMTQQ